MRVVAAGVHHARGLGAVRHVVRLLNGQGVDIRAQHTDARAAACAVQAGDDGGLAADALMRDAAFVKLALDARSGMIFVQAKLRVAVKFPPQRDELGAQTQAVFFQGVHGRISFLSLWRGSFRAGIRGGSARRRAFRPSWQSAGG